MWALVEVKRWRSRVRLSGAARERGVQGVDTVLWPDDVDSPLGYPCDSQRLPISEAARAEIDRLAALYQSSLDWADPTAPGPWSPRERERFNTQARSLLEDLRSELPDGWVVEDRFRPV